MRRDAVALVTGIYNLMNKAKTYSADIDKRLEEARQQGREEATKQFKDKYKEFKGDLGELPSGGRTEIEDTGQMLSEDDFRNMDEAKRRKLLGG